MTQRNVGGRDRCMAKEEQETDYTLPNLEKTVT